VPLQERIRRDDPGDFLKDSSTQSLRLGGQAPTLVVGEAKAPAAQLLPKHAILLAQVVDCELLLLVHPSGHCDQQKPERVDNWRHLEPALSQASQEFPVFGRYGVIADRRRTEPFRLKFCNPSWQLDQLRLAIRSPVSSNANLERVWAYRQKISSLWFCFLRVLGAAAGSFNPRFNPT
jgi:hypothetical protein